MTPRSGGSTWACKSGRVDYRLSCGMMRSARSWSNRSRNESAESWKSRKPSARLLDMSAKVSTLRPRSASVCHHEASSDGAVVDELVLLYQSGPDVVGVAHPALERVRLAGVLGGLDPSPSAT